MTNSSVRKQRGERHSSSSMLLLIGQFLTIAGILLILSADDLRSLWAGSDSVLDKLDQLTFSITELANEHTWQQQYPSYRSDLDEVLRLSQGFPGLRERLLQVDATVKKMAQIQSEIVQLPRPSAEADRLAAELGTNDRAAVAELVNARRIVRSRLSSTHERFAAKMTSLKVLLSGACLAGFGVVLVFRKFRIDRARQKRLEQELRSTNEEVATALSAARDGIDARNRFLRNLGQGIERPLDEIIHQTTILLETDLGKQQRISAQKTLSAAESVAAAISDVLDYSQLEAAKLNLESVEFDPGGLVQDVVETFHPRARDAGVWLRSFVAEGLPAMVKGDPSRLRQVLDNLVDNAVKFTERGEIVLSVAEAGWSDGRVKLRFEVKDTGIGINEQVRGRLFQPYAHNGDLVIRERGGTGLGLAISKRLVELMGGVIDATSEPGRGTAFCFTAVCESPLANPEETAPDSIAKLAVQVNAPARQATGSDRRLASRFRINHPTLLKSKVAGMAVVRILDVSASGVRVSIPFRLPLNSEVEIRIEDENVPGIVRNCVCKAATEFHIGIELVEPVSTDGRSYDRVLRRVRA